MKLGGDSRAARFWRHFIGGTVLILVLTIWLPLKLLFEGAGVEEILWALARMLGAGFVFGIVLAIGER
jgi:hypothetical protein